LAGKQNSYKLLNISPAAPGRKTNRPNFLPLVANVYEFSVRTSYTAGISTRDSELPQTALAEAHAKTTQAVSLDRRFRGSEGGNPFSAVSLFAGFPIER